MSLGAQWYIYSARRRKHQRVCLGRPLQGIAWFDVRRAHAGAMEGSCAGLDVVQDFFTLSENKMLSGAANTSSDRVARKVGTSWNNCFIAMCFAGSMVVWTPTKLAAFPGSKGMARHDISSRGLCSENVLITKTKKDASNVISCFGSETYLTSAQAMTASRY